MEKIIGIDLGTTNSVVAILEGGEPVIIPNSRGDRLTPSIVAFSDKREILVGQVAKNQIVINSERSVSSVKRHMGTDYKIKIGRKKYTPQEISSFILRKLKKDAEEYLQTPITKAVITVPAYFDDNQRQATKDAGKIAGLEVLRIINEPTAAALSYGLRHEENQIVIVLDLGGGTYDVSILELGDGVFEVRSTSGVNHLGGDDFDERIINYLADRFEEQEKIDLRQDRMALQKLKEEAEKAKIELSEATVATINIPFITADANGPKHLNIELSRTEFEGLIQDLINQMIPPIEKALEDASLSSAEINRVILAGGSTRIPAVREAFRSALDNEFYRKVNPDECVALGAAIQAGILGGDVRGVVLVDVTPLSLGIETEGGIFVPLINRNTTIPTASSKTFTTIADGQSVVEVHVLQGENPQADKNISLGKFQLGGIRSARKGDPHINVEFDIDVDGIVHVTAEDVDTGNQQTIRITNAMSYSSEEIERMVAEAELQIAQSEKYNELLVIKHDVEKLVKEVNQALEQGSSEIDKQMSEELTNALNDLQAALNVEDIEEIQFNQTALLAMYEELRKTLKNDSGAEVKVAGS